MNTIIPDNEYNSNTDIIKFEVPEYITEIGNCAFSNV